VLVAGGGAPDSYLKCAGAECVTVSSWPDRRLAKRPDLATRRAAAAPRAVPWPLPDKTGHAGRVQASRRERAARRMQGAQGGRPIHFVHRHVVGDDPAYGEVGRNLGAAAQRLAELRNAVGPGMGGRNSRSTADRPQLAASVATGIALFPLG
jgi:hypothetical protein